ncbi:MAG: MarR family winged helix-turn-helix transcriptional regulator [Acidimicrobiales bacterium]
MRPDTGDDLVDALLAAGHRVRTAVDACLRADGLSLARLKLLKLLADGPMPMGQLSEAMAVVPRSTTDLVDGLVGAGLVERRPHPTDRRVVLLDLTDHGRERLAGGRARATEVTARATRALSAADRRRLVELLAAVAPAGRPAGGPGRPGRARGVAPSGRPAR